MRRFFLFDEFNTWHDWRLTLTAKNISNPEPKTNYVAIDGMSGTLDLTESLTGEVAYNDRTLVASFWSSEGTYQEREAVVQQIIASLHGKKVKIVEPDDTDHYFLGRCMVKNLERSQVHIAFDIEAVCDPWRYAIEETNRRVALGDNPSVVILNRGVKTLCPTIKLEGTIRRTLSDGSIQILNRGTFKLADIKLRQGINVIGFDGSGFVTFIYREAGL